MLTRRQGQSVQSCLVEHVGESLLHRESGRDDLAGQSWLYRRVMTAWCHVGHYRHLMSGLAMPQSLVLGRGPEVYCGLRDAVCLFRQSVRGTHHAE